MVVLDATRSIGVRRDGRYDRRAKRRRPDTPMPRSIPQNSASTTTSGDLPYPVPRATPPPRHRVGRGAGGPRSVRRASSPMLAMAGTTPHRLPFTYRPMERFSCSTAEGTENLGRIVITNSSVPETRGVVSPNAPQPGHNSLAVATPRLPLTLLAAWIVAAYGQEGEAMMNRLLA